MAEIVFDQGGAAKGEHTQPAQAGRAAVCSRIVGVRRDGLPEQIRRVLEIQVVGGIGGFAPEGLGARVRRN